MYAVKHAVIATGQFIHANQQHLIPPLSIPSLSLTMPPPPDPFHVLRTHSASLASIAFGGGNTLLYSGGQDGFVSITDLRTRRSILFWKAHEGGVLGVGEWDGRLITSVPLSHPKPFCAEMEGRGQISKRRKEGGRRTKLINAR